MAPSWRSGDLGASGDRRGLDRERLAARIGVPMSAIEDGRDDPPLSHCRQPDCHAVVFTG